VLGDGEDGRSGRRIYNDAIFFRDYLNCHICVFRGLYADSDLVISGRDQGDEKNDGTWPELDPQQIVVIALAGLFGLFCSLILASQFHLIMLNQTTVESLSYRSMRDREQALLSQMHKWYHLRAKRRTRKQWDEEWGRIGIEGNLWWLGSPKANWEAVMGKNVWWWILPVGRPLDDGLNYPTNPRFDGAGRWRRRKEWPSDLR